MRAKLNAQPNQSLIDGIAALQVVATSQEPIGCRELARNLGFETSRANRLLKTLAYIGVVRQTANRKYTAGPGMHVLAAQSLFASGFMNEAVPALAPLHKFGLTVAMGVLWRKNVTFLYHAPPGLSPTEAMGRIGLYPATSSGIGMALLASADNDFIAETYSDGDIPGFPQGLESLLIALNKIRTDGYARILSRPEQDIHTIAVTVGKPIYAAIGLSGWIPEANTPQIVSALKGVSEKLTSQQN